jgi:hypothetical protein
MRDHVLELIAALVEGRLEDETEARALIESSAEARREYESQLRVRQALTGLGAVSMTESERSALHRDVWTALRSHPESRPAGTPWYVTWLPAAAVVALVMGLVGVLAGGGDQQTATFSEIGAAIEDGASTAAATESTSGAAGEAAGGDDADGGMTPLDAPTTTMSASTEGHDLAADDAAYFSRQAERMRAGQTSETVEDTTAQDSGFDDCVAEAGLEDHVAVDTVPAPAGTDEEGPSQFIVAAPEGVAIADAPLSFVDPDTCQVVYADE